MHVSDNCHSSICRESRTEEEGELLCAGWAPQSLLNFSKDYLPLNSLFLTQVNKGCLPQEDATIIQFWFFFRSRCDPHHTKSHSRQTKADYSTYSSSLGSSLLCLIQSLCTYVHISIGCYTAVKKRFPNPFLFICLEGRTPYNGGRRKMKDVIFTTELRLLQNLGMQLFTPIGLLGMKLHSKLGGFHVFLHKAVLKKSCSITLRYREEILAQFHLDLRAFLPQTCAGKGDFHFFALIDGYVWILKGFHKLK